jgi:hypothetical protein
MEKKKWISPMLTEELLEDTESGTRFTGVEGANVHT